MDIVSVYCALGVPVGVSGKIDEAVKMYERSMKMNQAIYGEECSHPHIPIILNNLGQVYRDQEEHREGLKIHKRSINMKNVIYGEERTGTRADIAISLNDFGLVYRDQGNLKDGV